MHGSSRGKDLKDAEKYTHEMTDMIRKIFRQDSQFMPLSESTSYSCPVDTTSSFSDPDTMARSASAGVPAFVNEAPSEESLESGRSIEEP